MADPWPLAVGLLLGLAPRLVLGANGERRRSTALVAWALAAAALMVRALRTAPNDDEVFYLADSWAASTGQTAGALPMRYLAFRPFLWLPGPPSAALVAGRAVMAISTVLSALAAVRLARRIGAQTVEAALAGVLTLVWLANAGEGVVLRPEQLATTAVLLGIVLLVAPPERWRSGPATAAAFLLLTLAACLSHRRVALVPVAIGLLLWPGTGKAVRPELKWAAAGVVAGLLPSLIYVLWADSFASLWYWNWTFVVRHSWVPRAALGTRLPVAPLLIGAAGAAAVLLDRRERRSAAGVVAMFWLASTVLAVLIPFTLPYALGSWMALGLVLGARAASRLLTPPAPVAGQRIYAAALGVLGLMPLVGPGLVDLVRSPPPVRSQLALVDWLHEAAGGGAVAAVAPYHPIKAANAWRLWNAWWYCYLRDPAFNRELNPRLGDLLRSGEARVIGWDPWPQASGYRNVLGYAVANGFLSRREAPAAALELRRRYRLVRWKDPLPEHFGGGRFLVLRSVPLDDRVVVLPEARIAF